MALYIPHSIFHLARLLYARPKLLDPTTYVLWINLVQDRDYLGALVNTLTLGSNEMRGPFCERCVYEDSSLTGYDAVSLGT